MSAWMQIAPNFATTEGSAAAIFHVVCDMLHMLLDYCGSRT